MWRKWRIITYNHINARKLHIAANLKDSRNTVRKWNEIAKANCRTGNWKDYKRICRQICEEFDDLPLTDVKKPKVGVVGEILVKYHPTANNDIVGVIDTYIEILAQSAPLNAPLLSLCCILLCQPCQPIRRWFLFNQRRRHPSRMPMWTTLLRHHNASPQRSGI